MYMFYADPFGDIPFGNEGQIKVPVHIAHNMRRLEKLARSFKAGRRGKVYVMTTWTQQMSELGPVAFCNYIADNGMVINV